MLHVSLQPCLCPLYRAVIRGGNNAGRLTLIADDGSVMHDDNFAESCCTNGGGCEKYTSRRPLTPIGPPDRIRRTYVYNYSFQINTVQDTFTYVPLIVAIGISLQYSRTYGLAVA